MMCFYTSLNQSMGAGNERGTSFVTVMLMMLMIGTLGVGALTITGMENSMAGAVRMVEEGTTAAEACVGLATRAIRLTIKDPEMDDIALPLLAPQGPVPALNKTVFSQEINGTLRNNADIAVGTGNAPNLVMNVNGYVVNGDIDFLFSQQRKGDDLADKDKVTRELYYRIDCVAANAATGATSRVIATYECLDKTGEGCIKRGSQGS